MRLAFLGCGYVGLVSGACLSSTGNHVHCADLDAAKVEALKKGRLPIFESMLDTIVEEAVHSKRLLFTVDVRAAIEFAEIVFISVGTEEKPDGSVNLDGVFACINQIIDAATAAKTIVIKSTVPVGTADCCKEMIAKRSKVPHVVISNPEFLKEGDAVNDFLKPDRVVIGSDDGAESVRAREALRFLYKPFMRRSERLLFVSNRSAELIKYCANAFLATKVSFVNEVALLCEKMGANIHEVRRGLTTDGRIGDEFFFPGPGYGGSCFPKDTHALIRQAKEYEFDFQIVAATDRVNQRQKEVLFEKLQRALGERLGGSCVAIWGGAFKANTDDIRQSPALVLIDRLLASGAAVHLSDPKSNDNLKKIYGARIACYDDPYEALNDADAWCVVTEWQRFRTPDFSRIKQIMRRPLVIDGRNLYDKRFVESLGFEYYGIGI